MKKLNIGQVVSAVGASLIAIALSVTVPASATVPGNNVLASATGSGVGGNNHSGWSSFGTGAILTANGKYVFFNSKASDLISGDSNSKQDVYSRDLSQNSTTRVSVSSSGVEGNNDSDVSAASESGRYVVFRSTATNLIDGQPTSGTNTFLRDTKLGVTSLIASGTYARVTGISNDGKYAVLESVNGNNHIYLLNVSTLGQTQLDAPTSGAQQSVDSSHSVMNCDGSLVAFDSTATNLVTGDTNGKKDVFVVDLRNGVKVTDLTINANDDSTTPSLSCNGNFVGYMSRATNLVSGVSSSTDGHYYRYDRIDESLILLDRLNNGSIATPTSLSYSGPSLQLSNDGNAVFKHSLNLDTGTGVSQFFIRNVAAATTEVLTRDESGNALAMTPYSPFMSLDGKWVGYVAQHSSGIFSGTTDSYDNIAVGETGL